jgi:hypothetical protein
MNGTFDINDPLPEVMEFIRTLKKNPNISPLNQEITTSKFKKAFSRIHEKKPHPHLVAISDTTKQQLPATQSAIHTPP